MPHRLPPKTDWFPAHIKPVRQGVYELRQPLLSWALWRDGAWCVPGATPWIAARNTRCPSEAPDRDWRGLSRPVER